MGPILRLAADGATFEVTFDSHKTGDVLLKVSELDTYLSRETAIILGVFLRAIAEGVYDDDIPTESRYGVTA